MPSNSMQHEALGPQKTCQYGQTNRHRSGSIPSSAAVIASASEERAIFSEAEEMTDGPCDGVVEGRSSAP